MGCTLLKRENKKHGNQKGKKLHGKTFLVLKIINNRKKKLDSKSQYFNKKL